MGRKQLDRLELMTHAFLPLTAAALESALALMHAFYTEEALEYVEPRARRALELLLADPARGKFIFIHRDERPAGYFVITAGFSLEFAGPFALLDEFYVAPTERGMGLGALALEHIFLTARSLGVAAIRLEVDRANPRVRAFYERSGFVAHDRDLMTKWFE